MTKMNRLFVFLNTNGINNFTHRTIAKNIFVPFV